MAQVNFESKQLGIPEDRKFMRFVETCYDTLDKTIGKLTEAIYNKSKQV